MPVCPLDYRYGRSAVKEIFSEESRLRYMLRVEHSLIYALSKLGKVPENCSDVVARAMEEVRLERVREIEAEIRHDVMAVVRALAEKSGDCGKYIHLGATSNDIIDTATALQLKDYLAILERDLCELEDALESLALKHRDTVMLGRTHGQAAVPITFGLKMANYLAEILRHHERVLEMKNRVLVGKMLGAVGTGAAMGKDALRIQNIAMEFLGLKPEESPTQIVARDRYVELISVLGGIATSLEKFATEIRNLQRTEIGEVQEGFDTKRQVGSSTMAQKKNPIVSENICGLARVVRGFLITSHESAVLWHERDLTNSSAERFVVPHVCVLVDDMLVKMTRVFRELVVNEKRMLENLRAHEDVMAERIIMFLVSHGWSRQDAHEKIRQISMLPGRFRDNLLKDPDVGPILEETLEDLFDPVSYLGVKDSIIDAIIEKKKKMHKNCKKGVEK